MEREEDRSNVIGFGSQRHQDKEAFADVLHLQISLMHKLSF